MMIFKFHIFYLSTFSSFNKKKRKRVNSRLLKMITISLDRVKLNLSCVEDNGFKKFINYAFIQQSVYCKL